MMLEEHVVKFLDCFETVFHADWGHTRECLSEIPQSGSFLDPTPGQFYDGDGLGCCSWSNYAGLLAEYRTLRALLISEGLYEPDWEKRKERS